MIIGTEYNIIKRLIKIDMIYLLNYIDTNPLNPIFRGDLFFFIPIDTANQIQMADRIDSLIFMRQLMPWDLIQRIIFDSPLSVCEFESSDWEGYLKPTPERWNILCFTPDKPHFVERTPLWLDLDMGDPTATPIANIVSANDLQILDKCKVISNFEVVARETYEPTTGEGIGLRWSIPKFGLSADDQPLYQYLELTGPFPSDGNFVRL